MIIYCKSYLWTMSSSTFCVDWSIDKATQCLKFPQNFCSAKVIWIFAPKSFKIYRHNFAFFGVKIQIIQMRHFWQFSRFSDEEETQKIIADFVKNHQFLVIYLTIWTFLPLSKALLSRSGFTLLCHSSEHTNPLCHTLSRAFTDVTDHIQW